MNHVISSCARATNRLMRPLGVRLIRNQSLKPDQNTLASALERLERLQLGVQTIIEVYNFRLTSDSLRFHDMCAHLEKAGFRCFDIMDILRRPADETLWQADFVFLRDDHPVFQKTTFR